MERTIAPWWLTAVASELWPTAVESKALLQALLPDAGSKEVFTCAKSNNRRLLHVGEIDRTSKNGVVRCEDIHASKFVTFEGGIHMWEAGSKWKTPQRTKFNGQQSTWHNSSNYISLDEK
uniref:Uncharacterized protein n=1 Tax=Oryza punctata TaxID=4537 RepID=A0A0E0LSC9_ORYPU